MISLYINNEFSKLRKVVLGIGVDFGGCPNLEDAYDPKSKENIINNTFPNEVDVVKELANFSSVLKTYDIDVIRPQNISQCNQIFARDVSFVIEDQFFISNMIRQRRDELLGLKSVLLNIDKNNINYIPQDVFVEGGDVVVSKNHLFVGFSHHKDFAQYEVSRTNEKALDFLSKKFPNKKIIGFDLHKSDFNSLDNCLHLDCCFQPLGLGHVIVYADGFRSKNDMELINNIFGNDKIILIDRNEMSNMFSNVFSISKNIIVSEKKFSRLNSVLRAKGYIVEEVVFSEISKMGGLLRCATLPLIRDYE